MSKSRAQQALELFQELESENSNRSRVLEECARFTCPAQQDLLYKSIAGREGDMKTAPVSGLAIRASQRLINFIVSNTWQPGRQNFTLRHAVERRNQVPGASKWFGEATDAIHAKLNSSNFMPRYVELISSWVRFGQAHQNHRYDTSRARVVFKNYATNSNTYTMLDAEESLAGMACNMRMSAQAAKAFFNRPDDELPPELITDLTSDATAQKLHEFVYIVRERRERKRERKDFRNMKYEALTIHRDSAKLVREEGFRRLRWVSPRFSVVTCEKYGRGATHDALYDIREQQTVRYDVRQGAELAIWPVTLFPDSESADDYRNGSGTVPGAVGYYDASSGGKPEFSGVGPQASLGFEYAADLDTAVRENFYLDLLDVMEGLNAGASATEILERAKRQVNGMLPMVSQLDNEYFEPTIESLLEVLIEEGEIDPPPEELLDGDQFAINVSYHNELESKLRMLKNMNLLTFLGQSVELSGAYEASPELDTLLPKMKALRHLAVNNDVSSEILNDENTEKKAMKDYQKALAEERDAERLASVMKPADPLKAPEQGSMAGEMMTGVGDE